MGIFNPNKKLVQEALSRDSSGAVQSNFSLITPTSGVFQTCLLTMRGGSSSTPTASVSSNKRPPRPPPNASSDGGANSAGGASAAKDASVAGDASADGDATEAVIKVTETHSNKRKTPEDATEDDTEVSQVTEPKGKKRSDVWNHFDMDPKPSKYAKCRHCKTKIAAQGTKYGTGGMNNHLKICKKKPKEEKGQQTLDFQPARLGGEGKLVAATFNQDACTKAVILFVILDEHPFRVVEGEGFKELCRVLESRFKIPSRMTISRGVLNLYEAEKEKMKNYFQENNVRICLTTDTWTSNAQNKSYMVVTAHFIDKDWKLHKLVINFFQILGHSGEVIGKMLEECLLDWELPGVFTITLDNVSANDLAIDYLREDGHLKEQVISSNGVLNTKFMQVRCAAHVLALVVNAGLGEYHMDIKRVRAVVKHVMSSPARLSKFMDCAKQEKIDCRKGLVLDVDTRWNSTYMMLEAACRYQKAFERLAREDKAFKKKFCFNERSIPPVFSTSTGASNDVDMEEASTIAHNKGKKKNPPPPPIHAPYMEDWANARSFGKFLKVFFDLTVKFSYCTRVTSHEFLFNISVIHRTMNTWVKSSDPFLSGMGTKMLDKFNKYWGEYEKMNTLMFIDVLLDPREKMKGLNFILDTLDITGPSLRKHLSTYVKTDFQELFEEYKCLYANDENMSSATGDCNNVTQSSGVTDDEDSAYASLIAERAREDEEDDNVEGKTELELYLEEKREPRISPSGVQFEILGWWRTNSTRYPVLSHMARDILAIPVSSVASESSFSTGRRVIDSYRSSLLPKTVEALICTQSWLQTPVDLDPNTLGTDDAEDVSEFLGSLATSKFIRIDIDDDEQEEDSTLLS
ncbi:hypothetical protein C5167_011320 [Papaver somniferum]|uniref:BED-type domain-containing protein n=1 Tax=Papaver somniferum TaxID=3469 RepID=A0A4Y7K2M9_PAPSO|nr:hypothetical protein C5167_011320 [Papaver somniferum]